MSFIPLDDLDTGIGSAPAARPTTRGQVTDSNPPDTGIGVGSSVATRFSAFDETPRLVVVSPTGASFNTALGGPS